MEGSLANVKRVQYLIDQTSRARHMLDLNSTVMKTMTRSSAEFPASAILSDIGPMVSFEAEVESIMGECQIHHKSAESLLIRATSISQHVGSLLLARLWTSC